MTDDDIGVPENAPEIEAALRRACRGLPEVPPGVYSEVSSYIDSELAPMRRSYTESYLVLGSYRDPYVRRLRAVQSELNKPVSTYPVVLGDTASLDLPDSLPAFQFKFHLLAATADEVVAVFEKESGGESAELGKISETYFGKSHVLPRDYVGLETDRIASPEDVLKEAADIYFADDLTDEAKEENLRALLGTAREQGVDVDADDIVAHLQARTEPPATYSWVHRNDFRQFELAGRCYPWKTEAELRDIARDIPF